MILDIAWNVNASGSLQLALGCKDYQINDLSSQRLMRVVFTLPASLTTDYSGAFILGTSNAIQITNTSSSPVVPIIVGCLSRASIAAGNTVTIDLALTDIPVTPDSYSFSGSFTINV